MIELGGAWNNELTEVMELEQHMQHIWFWLVWLTEQHGHANINLEATLAVTCVALLVTGHPQIQPGLLDCLIQGVWKLS